MTTLSPLEEVLFQAWTKANGVSNHDDPDNQFDHRAIFKHTNGMIQPPGLVNQAADNHNAAMQPQEQGQAPLDPLAAAVELKKVQADSAHKQHAEANKLHMKKMELEHKSAENERDRQHKTAIAQLQHQQKSSQAAMQIHQKDHHFNMQMQHKAVEMQNKNHQAQQVLAHKTPLAQQANEQKAKSGLAHELIKRSVGQV